MTQVVLRAGAPLGRRTSCALVDPSEVRMDAAEIRRTLVEPQLALPRVDVAVVRGDGFSDGMLVILPSGELAWLPSEALVDADEPNLVRVVRPLDALAARISACWLACEPPGNDEWIVAQFDAEYVYLQRDAGGPLHRALPEDVVGLDGYVPWQAICTPLTIDASQPAAIATAWTMFMKRLLGDGDDDLRVRSAERWTVDIPGPQVEPPSVDAAQPARADSPAAAIDASLASDAPVGPDASSARPIVEHRGREVERSAQPRRAPEPEPEPEPQYSSRVVKDPDPFVAPTAVRSSSAAPRAASEATPPRKTLIPRLATDIGGADPSSHARSIVVPPRPPRGAPPSAPERADAPHSTGSPDIAAPRPAPPSTALPRPPQRQPFAREAHLKAPPAAAEPTRLRATEAVEERKSVAPVPARDLTRFEPSAASTVASPPGPALVRGLTLAAPEPSPAVTPARTPRRGSGDAAAPIIAPPRRESSPQVADIEYRASATSIEIGTIEVQVGASQAGVRRATNSSSAPTSRATTRTGSLLAEIPTSRTWKGLL